MAKMNRIRKQLAVLWWLLVLLPLSAQERTDTSYVFRFVPSDNMFYVPWSGNGRELARLEACLARYRQRILAGEIPLHVDGHAAGKAAARVRSNRVKSELITRQGLTEACFVTQNHADGENYVTVRLVVRSGSSCEGKSCDCAVRGAKAVPESRREPEPSAAAVPESPAADTVVPGGIQDPSAAEAGGTDGGTLSLRLNLLRWATLTPDLGLEWRIGRSWGLLVHGSWTSWSWNGKDRRYALWEVSPEVRYYLGRERRGYIGAMYKAGAFNYKLSATGRQGDLMGGGVTGGYRLRLNNALSMDFDLGIGCLHVDYDRYTVTGGVRVRRGKETKNWWGPVNAGVTLVWKLVK